MRKIIFAMAFGALLLPDYGLTLGLGEIEVSTALNQELNAEIQLLSAAPEDVETLIVTLASREEFSRAGIERPYLLSSLRFSAEMDQGRPIIRVTSDKPIREPFLNFLVEIDWPKGHMMREYTILLDPPVFMQPQAPVQQEQSRPAAMESSASGSMRPSQAESDTGFRPAVMATPPTTMAAPVPSADFQAEPARQAVVTQAAPTYTPRSYQPPSGYRIQQGDTLWSLADAMRPDQSVSIEQMMLAMLRTNPEAFIDGNVNGLKKGYILRIPDRDDIVTLNHADAVDVVREQNALWREYQQTVAGGAPVSAMEPGVESEGGMAVDESGDARLEIVAAGTGTSASGTKDPTQMSTSELRAELAIARESLETARLEKEELQQRVGSLEGQVDRMKSLLTLEDSDLAEMQQAVTPSEAEPMAEPEMVEEFVAAEEGLAVDETELDEAAALEQVVVDDLTTTEEFVEEAGLGEEAETVFVDDQMAADEQGEMAADMAEQPAAVTDEFLDEAYEPPVFSAPQKQDPLSMLLNNPMMLAAAGGGLLLVLLLLALIMKRRKSGGSDEEAVVSNLDEIDAQLDDGEVIRIVDEDAVEQGLAEVEEAPRADEQAAETAQAAEPSHADTVVEAQGDEAAESRDDVIAEADVYLAYGIYQQAEELLQNALKDNPDNDSYRVKLAETYLAGKNSDAFVELATEMNQRRNGEDTPAWQKVAEIGQQLVPGHALFTAASDGGLDIGGSTSETAPADLDLSVGGDETVAPELDLSLDETAADDSEPTLDSLSGGGVEFDLSETGAEEEAESGDDEGVEFDLTETQAFEPDQSTTEFDLDIDASELGIDEEPEAAEASEPDTEFDLDLSDEAEALVADAEAEGGELSLDEIADEVLDFDAEEAGIDAEASDEAVAEIEAPAEIEEPVEEATIIDFSEAAPSADSMDDDLDLSDLDDIDEVSTKLDLAKAYLDMGDADGTRSILDEVMSEGNDEQKKEADELLRQLG